MPTSSPPCTASDATASPPGATRRLVLRAAAVAGLATPFLGRGAAAATTWTLFSQQTNLASATTRGLRRFSDLVRDRTDGALLINIRTAGMLPIDANQVMEAVASAKVELGDDANPALTAPVAAVMRLPLLATTPAEWDRVAKVVRPALADALKNRSIVLLGHYRSAMQLFWSREKAGGFLDIARQKLRIQALEQADFVRHYGGVHVITSTVEAGEALAAGKLDGTFGSAFMTGRMWRAWLRHVYLAGPNYNDAVIVAGQAAMDRLPEALAAVLFAAAEDTAAWIARTQDAEEAQILAQLRSEGVQVTPANRAEVLDGTTRLPAAWDNWVRLRGSDMENLLAAVRQVLDR